MNKTIKGFLWGVSSALATTALVAATNDDFARGKNLEIFFNVFREVNLSYVDKPDSEKMVRNALDGMLEQIDPYTTYMSEEDYAQFEELTTGEYAGIGAVIFKHVDSLYTEISEVIQNSPADKAGLVMGDRLLMVDTTNLKGLESSDISSLLRGNAGSQFTLKYRSLLTNEEKETIIKREIIHSNAVNYAGYINGTDGVGYINLSTFSDDCSSEVRAAIEKLKSEGELKSLILDLRDNGGGVLQEAVNIVSLFVDKGTEVVSINGRSFKEPKVYKTLSEPIAKDIPLAVVVNGSSASASEVVAGALQDLDRALIVGSQSYGKGLVQTPKEVGYGSVLKVTTAKYYTPSGRCIQAVDFSNRNEDGSVGSIPDSLRKEFKTVGGRTVLDGGGITPDSLIKTKGYNRFVQNVAVTGTYLEEYVKEYYKNNQSKTDFENFSLTDSDLSDFATLLEERNFKVISLTNYHIDKLKEAAKSEYYSSKIEKELEALEKKMELNIREDVELNKQDLKLLIEMDILTAFKYKEGRVKHFAQSDSLVKKTAMFLEQR
ncbi:MAG: S41 family peptidase [Rikenellaceae bacterium]